MCRSGPPLIGVTTYGPDDNPTAPALSLPVAYSDSIARAGGLAVLLPPTPDPDALLSRLDALVLAGGGDIDPHVHTDETHESVYMVTPARDAFELDLVRRALARETMPVLGICRGMQILNIAQGGDLHLHLPDVHGETVLHRAPPREPTLHPVEVLAGSPLDSIYGERRFPVCSWHHQEVRRLGTGLEVIARADDGVVEAVVLTDHAFVLGVQWHPEMQTESDPLQRRLFEALVAQAEKTR